EPIGVVAVITPWNWPVMLTMRMLAPVLAAGNVAVLKPAALTSAVTVAALAHLCADSELPEGVVGCVLGGKSVGRNLVEHRGVDMVGFTGSTAAGVDILRVNAPLVRPSVLELG